MCVSANIKETRLDLQHEILIVVNFKRKITFIKEAAYFDEQNKADSEVENDEETSDDSSNDESLADQRQEEDKVKIRE